MTDKGTFHFTIAAALLRELGERLVGGPALAIAELIKNAYDADATKVRVKFEGRSLVIEDNGHGMTLAEFKDYWMRVGTTHKQETSKSRKFKRPLTGSKGVGRLSVQYLGRELELSTTAEDGRELLVLIDWDNAKDAGDLQLAEAAYEHRDKPGRYLGASTGFRVRIEGLIHDWRNASEFKSLAREIWKLEPPIGGRSEREKGAFKVDLEGVAPGAAQSFAETMRALTQIWHAKINGRLSTRNPNDPEGSRRVTIHWQFAEDRASGTEQFLIEQFPVKQLEFELRIFDLIGRQPKRIKVADARKYLDEHGGVRIFDAGFGLNHYGLKTDWLNIERDHSHRLSRSKLLPENLQVPGGLTYLPTQDRILGEVRIDTSAEFSSAREDDDPERVLSIAVTRDRLLDNRAFRSLVHAVRLGIDLYAMQEARRRLQAAEEELKETESAEGSLSIAANTLQSVRKQLPPQVFEVVEKQIETAARRTKAEHQYLREERGMLGALATAGISAIAFEHEAVRQYRSLARMASSLRKLADEYESNELSTIANKIKEWVEHARETRAVFAPLMDEESRKRRASMNANNLLSEVISNSKTYLRNITIDLSDLPRRLMLPPGSYAEWTAIFQNVIINAANAVEDTTEKKIAISALQDERGVELYIQDTGVGVDLRGSERLFRPFYRRARISEMRRVIGAGGTGMGLAIVRVLAEAVGVEVSFVEPDEGYTTCFMVSWEISK